MTAISKAGVLVREYLAQNPSISSRTAARTLYAKHPKDIKSVEQARGMIRQLRGQSGEHKRSFSTITPEIYDQRRADFGIVKSFNRDHSPHVIKGYKRIGIMSDVHIPYHDEDALAWHARVVRQ
jgi:hypothetical protein